KQFMDDVNHVQTRRRSYQFYKNMISSSVVAAKNKVIDISIRHDNETWRAMIGQLIDVVKNSRILLSGICMNVYLFRNTCSHSSRGGHSKKCSICSTFVNLILQYPELHN